MHDELKEKDFRFEMSLISKETDGFHRINPAPYHTMATESGLAAQNEDDSDNEM